MKPSFDTIIVGAGLAGLAGAVTLQKAGRNVLVCEGSDEIGGRVRTDIQDGFRLDRGFQVLLTAYPEARKFLDYSALDLRPFYPGALVRFNKRWHRVADPFRRPISGLSGLLNPIGSFPDKLRVARLRLGLSSLGKMPPDRSTLEALRAEGFSDSLINRFFKPFLGGVFLEPGLNTTVKKFESVFSYFARGDSAVPALGMAAIPRQLAGRLQQGTLQLNTHVAGIESMGVRLATGQKITCRSVLMATSAREAARLLNEGTPSAPANSVSCFYYETPELPIRQPILLLNGEGNGPINNLSFLTALAPEYAPPRKHLASVSVIDRTAMRDPQLETNVRAQLYGWFGSAVESWRHLRTYNIAEAVPAQTASPELTLRIREGLYRCGDYCGIASINTAMASGRLAAEAILRDQP